MSGRSPNSRELITAGLVGVGVGFLAAGVSYAIATSPKSHLSQTPERRTHRVGNSSERKSSTGHESNRCKICGVDMSSEPSISLACKHSFHRKCLFSSYVVQMQVNRSHTFQCPINSCQAGISENIIESLIGFH